MPGGGGLLFQLTPLSVRVRSHAYAVKGEHTEKLPQFPSASTGAASTRPLKTLSQRIAAAGYDARVREGTVTTGCTPITISIRLGERPKTDG